MIFWIGQTGGSWSFGTGLSDQEKTIQLLVSTESYKKCFNHS